MHGFRLSSPFAAFAAASLGAAEGFKLIQIGGDGQLAPEWNVFGDRLEALVLAPVGGSPSSDKRVRTQAYTPLLHRPEARAAVARTSDRRVKDRGQTPALPLNQWLVESQGWTPPSEEPGLLAAVQAAQFGDADFVSLADNAAGLSTLAGLGPVLRQPNLLGVSLRINLFGSHEPGANTLHAVDRLLREAGLQPFGLSPVKYASAALPWPFMNSYPAETQGGRPLFANAIYLREPVDGSVGRLIKAAAVRALIDMADQAAEILITQSGPLADRLDVAHGLDLLAQEIQRDTGQAYGSYAEFMDAFDRDAGDFYGFSQRNGAWLASLMTVGREAPLRISALEQVAQRLVRDLALSRRQYEAIRPPPVEAVLAEMIGQKDARSPIHPDHHWIFDHFTSFRGPVDLRMNIDFLGCRTSAEYGIATFEIEIADYQCALPVLDEEYFEWIDLLQAVLEAGPVFTMLELGAGYGRWSARAAAAARQLGKRVRLGVAEAEPRHQVWLDQHLQRNGVSPEDFRIFPQAVGGEHGEITFTVGRDDGLGNMWFGQSALEIDLEALEPSGEYYGAPVYHSQGWGLIRVPKIPLSEVLEPYDFIDLADFDLQGAEYEAIEEAIAPLTRKVRRLHIGTHSEEIEEKLRELLPRHGWVKLRDYSLHKTHETAFGPAVFVDGVQSWINPALIRGPSETG